MRRGAVLATPWLAGLGVGCLAALRWSDPLTLALMATAGLAGLAVGRSYRQAQTLGANRAVAEVGASAAGTAMAPGRAHDATHGPRAADSDPALLTLEAGLAVVGDAIVQIDRHGRIHYANAAVSRVFGFSPQDLVGRPVADLVPRPLRPLLSDCFARNQSDTPAAQVLLREMVGRRRDGSCFAAEIRIAAVPRVGDGAGLLCGFRDLSELRALEAQLLQAQKMESIGRLTGGIVHDFNNLLTVINGYCEMLMAQPMLTATDRSSLESVREAGRRAAALTRHLLAFSRKSAAVPRVLDCNEVLRQSRTLMARLIGEDVQLTLELAPEPMRIWIDPSQFDQALLNLVVNARDAMPTGGRLSIATRALDLQGLSARAFGRPEGPYVELRITDTGVGMTDEVQRRLFEPFFTTKPDGKGTGLGLSVVKSIVDAYQGTIRVESAVGRGTTFHLAFPVAATSGAAGGEAAAEPSPGKQETVLLVEDDEAVRVIASSLLKGSGYTVLEAARGSEAMVIAEASSRPIDLVLADLMMPEMNGAQLVSRLRARNPELRALFMTGYLDDAMERHGIELEPGQLLAKPFTRTALLTAVRHRLDGSAAPEAGA